MSKEIVAQKRKKGILDIALSLWKAGLCVIPLKWKDKAPAIPWAEYQARRPDASELVEWFEGQRRNIGIVCGRVSGNLVVIDFDNEATYKEFAEKYPNIVNRTWVAQTGRGYHVYLRTKEPVRTHPRNGVDIKGEGSYVVAPPSLHPSGRPYRWLRREGEILRVEKLPEFHGEAEERERRKVTELPERIPEGQRNTTLTSYAGKLRRLGFSEEEIRRALLAINQERCDPPLPEKEVEAIAKSIAKYPPGPGEWELGERAITLIAPQLAQEILHTLAGMDGAKANIRVRRAKAGTLALRGLKEHGFFARSETNALYYFYAPERRAYNLDHEAFKILLYKFTGVNPESHDFRFILADCRAAAAEADVRKVVKVAYWDGEEETLRVSRFDGTVYVLTGEEIREEENGKTVIFEDDPTWAPYTASPGENGSTLAWLAGLANWVEDREASELAYTAWLLSTFFTELCPTRPILLLAGEMGSGKTMLLRLTMKLLFGPAAEVAGLPDRPDDFRAAAAAQHILAIDNLDEFVPWIRDKLARLATGGVDYARKLYTTNEKFLIRYRAWVAATSHDPETFRRNDLADRLLLLRLQRIPEGDWKPERRFLEQAKEFRPWFWGDVLWYLNRVVARIRREGLPDAASIRLGDWESLGRVIAKEMGKEAIWDRVIANLASAQASLLTEEEPLVEALLMWLEDNQGKEVMGHELYQELTRLYWGERKPSPDWPKNAKWMGRKLEELRESLARIYGVRFVKRYNRQGTVYLWKKEGEAR
jgi:hypothetical protein